MDRPRRGQRWTTSRRNAAAAAPAAAAAANRPYNLRPRPQRQAQVAQPAQPNAAPVAPAEEAAPGNAGPQRRGRQRVPVRTPAHRRVRRDREEFGNMHDLLVSFYQWMADGRQTERQIVRIRRPVRRLENILAAEIVNLPLDPDDPPAPDPPAPIEPNRPYNLRPRAGRNANNEENNRGGPAPPAPQPQPPAQQPAPPGQALTGRIYGDVMNMNLNWLAELLGTTDDFLPGQYQRYRAPPEPTPEELEAARIEQAQKLPIAIMDNSHACAVCLDVITLKTIITPCYHQYCLGCLSEWIKMKNFCPVCRQKIRKVIYNIHSPAHYDEFTGAGMELPGVQEFGIDLPPFTAALKQRSNRILNMQMLAKLYEHFPTKGFPTQPLDFDLFEAAFIAPLERDMIAQHFRCFTYLHGYVCQRATDNSAPAPQNPQHSVAARKRLMIFMKAELETLSEIFDTALDTDVMLETLLVHLGELLKKHPDMQSAAFGEDFVKLFEQLTRLKTAVPYYDIIGQVLAEWINYSQCTQFANQLAYIKGTTYTMRLYFR